MTSRVALINLVEALAAGPPPPGNLAVPVFAHGSLVAEMYQPGDADPQKPHDRDEVYVIARGHARFFDGAAWHGVKAGSFIFVAAGQPHRFEQMSADFATWVFFYGPTGGEAVDQQR